MKIVGLCDCNSFFASCEKVFRPAWAHRAVVVLSNNDGCVVARSPEAKALGIPMGAPYFQIKNLADAKQVIVCSSNFNLYGDMSHRVMQTLSQWTPDLEIYSIDESFLDLTGLFIGPGLNANERECILPDTHDRIMALGETIVQTVPKWTGIPVALGLGPTKTLAKAANRIAKNAGERLCSLLLPDTRADLLKRLNIDDVWGVGRHLLPKFLKLGLKTAWHLSQVDPAWIRKNFSIVQEKMVRELQGEYCYDMETVPDTRQNIQYSRSFGHMIESLPELEEAVSTFAARGAEKLRKQKSVARAICVQLRTNRFRTDLPQAYPMQALAFPMPTNNSLEIISTALTILRRLYEKGYSYKNAGILLMNLTDEEAASRQGTLFDVDPGRTDEQREKEKKLMQTVDLINRMGGKGKIFFGSEGVDSEWKPNSGFVSPCFTTRWEDLPVAH